MLSIMRNTKINHSKDYPNCVFHNYLKISVVLRVLFGLTGVLALMGPSNYTSGLFKMFLWGIKVNYLQRSKTNSIFNLGKSSKLMLAIHIIRYLVRNERKKPHSRNPH